MQGQNKVLYPELSYKIVGCCFAVHNDLGSYAREKKYADILEQYLEEEGLCYHREAEIGPSRDRLDFIIENKIVLELKAKPRISREEYRQVQNYLQQSRLKLGILVNFRSRYLNPKRVIRIDKGK